MTDETWLTPDQARARFGELTVPAGVGPIRVHATFERPEGLWHPVFDQTETGLVLRGYQLHALFRQPPSRPPYRPKAR